MKENLSIIYLFIELKKLIWIIEKLYKKLKYFLLFEWI